MAKLKKKVAKKKPVLKKTVAKKVTKKVVAKKPMVKKKIVVKKPMEKKGVAARAATIGSKAAIVGIGTTEFSKNSGRSELSLACEAVLDCLKDAGLKPSDVDGMVTFTMDTNDEIEIARAIGCNDLTFY